LKINPADYIKAFKENQTSRTDGKSDISEDFALEYEMYVEKSRFAL
jgi:hypothetical protein